MTEPADPPILGSEEGPIARIVLNRPRAGNSLSFDLVAALSEQLTAYASRKDIKVIILSAMGGRIFSAGHDLNEFDGQEDLEFLQKDFAGITALMQQLMVQPQITIAKVEGVATAAGCELMAACDLALASSVARFGVPGVNIGFWCHTPQVPLSRTVGPKAAMMMLATGKLFPASHALSIGLINSIHEPEELDGAVDALAAEIASKAGSVLRRGKAAFRRQLGMSIPEAYGLAREQAMENIVDPDAREGIAAFLAKRPAVWPGD